MHFRSRLAADVPLAAQREHSLGCNSQRREDMTQTHDLTDSARRKFLGHGAFAALSCNDGR